MTLNEQLQTFAATRRAARSPEANQIMDNATAWLGQSGLKEHALNVGAIAPDFSLPNAVGEQIKLSKLLESGSVVLTFYRGAWCPYCNMQLQALQKVLPEIKALGANLIAVSPQKPDQALSLTEKHALEFAVLSDADNKVARTYGLVFTLPAELRELYLKMNIDLPELNSSANWELPFPATYVISQDFKVQLAFVDSDYTMRLEPSQILVSLRSIQ